MAVTRSEKEEAEGEVGIVAYVEEDLGAFKDEAKESNNEILLEIATELFNKYHHNPIFLDVVAALFSSKKTAKEWESCRDKVLETLGDASKTNPFYLKLSNYEQLPSNIQMCARFCSLFSKDYTFNKTDLIHLWASQQEDLLSTAATKSVGDEYFEELLKEGYFFEIIQEGTGDILGYKMHYLVNEFLKEIAKPEFCLVDESIGEINAGSILNLSFIVDSSWKAPSWMLNAKNLKSLLFLPRKNYEDFVEVLKLDEIFTSLTCLRALDLVAMNCETLPSSLVKLKDLRYLRLGISLGRLSESVTRLENLKILDLRHSSIMVLPSDFHINLKHLRHLYVGSRLIDMPSEISELKSLNTLDEFIVGKNNGLDTLGCLKLVGKLTVRFEKKNKHHEVLKDNNSITDLSLIWSPSYGGQTTGDNRHHFLQPPTSLESLAIRGWKEERFSNFPILEKLVSLCIEDCNNCKNLPNLSGLPYLRSLQLWDLKALEYVENGDDNNEHDASASYFPYLKYLTLANLQELKGWSSRKKEKEISLNCLQLRIKGCPKMMSMPQVPNLESLEAHNIHKTLLKFLSTYSSSSPPQPITKVQNLEIVSVVELDSTISFMEIKGCEKLNLGDDNMVKVWEGLKSLQTLKLIGISNLASLENSLMALEKLEVLSLHSFYELKTLPEWIGKLTKLQRLAIRNFPYLIALPESLGDLSALEEFQIQCCPLLKQIPDSVTRLNSLQLKI
ncbi:putative disease resistance protein RGA4 [Chenopodium quinoa]|uniref:putative disease resistance protein RGA4 n=1 Tax=Chenopodium quinoa TaxID=63459 RepID=UPI000B78152E|nr:putative disease resistance protein RGA4 [Chenopodium quinoa]